MKKDCLECCSIMKDFPGIVKGEFYIFFIISFPIALTFLYINGKIKLVQIFKPKEEWQMTTAQELQERFHQCMSLFIALGDEMRLSIIEVLTEEALDTGRPPGPVMFEEHALNVNEITNRTSLSRPAISHHLKILKDAGLVGVRQEGTANYYYLTLRESNRKLMELGYRLEEFMY